MLIPEDGCLPKITSSSLAPFNNVMIIKVPEKFRKPGETIYQLATLDPSNKKSEEWPADKYLDHLKSSKEKSFLKSNENEDNTNKTNKSEMLAVDKKKSLFLPKKEKSKKIKKYNLPDQRRINHDTRSNHISRITHDKRINQDTRINHDNRVHRDTRLHDDSRINHDNRVHRDTRLHDDSRSHHDAIEIDPWLPGAAALQMIGTSTVLSSYDQSLPKTYELSKNRCEGLLGNRPGEKPLYSDRNVRSFDHIPSSENIKSTKMPELVYSGSHKGDRIRKGPIVNDPQSVHFDGPSRNVPQKNNFKGPFPNRTSKKSFERPFSNASPKDTFENSYQNNSPVAAFTGIHRLSATESTLTGTNRNVSKDTDSGGMHRRDGLINDAYLPDNSYNIGYYNVPRNIPHDFDSYAHHYRDNFSSEPEYSNGRNYNQINGDDSSISNFNRSYANNDRNNFPSNSHNAHFNDVQDHNPTTNNCYDNNYPQYGQEGMWDSQCQPNLGPNEPFRMPENVSQRGFAYGNQRRSWRGNKPGNSQWDNRNRGKRGRGNNRYHR